MFQLKYNVGFLDLGADQKIEFERENPMFILEDFYKEYSSPIVIKYSENNVELLGAIFFELLPHQKQKIEVELWEKGSFDSKVTLVIDKANNDRRYAGKSDVNGFLLAGLSRFFYRIKYRALNTLQLGGERAFVFTTANPSDGSNGYIQHFFKTAENTFDYIIAPIRNEGFNGTNENSSGWMNDWMWQNLSNTPALPTTDITNKDYYSQHEHKYAVIFPRLQFVLNKIFTENGFTLDTTDLVGTGWENLFLEGMYPIYFYQSQYRNIYDSVSSTGKQTQPFTSSIIIDVSKSISPEVSCSNFILNICKKYGWTIIETGADNFKLIALKNVKTLQKLDITNYVSDAVQTDFSVGERIQAFANTFPSGEEFAKGASPEIAGGKYFEDPVEYVSDLPSLANINKYSLSTYDNSLIFVYSENKYYSVQLITSTITLWNNTRAWIPMVDNIYDYSPPNATETIKADVTTLPVYWTQFAISSTTTPLLIGGVERDNILLYGYFPVCKQSRQQNWGIRTVQYVGMVAASYIQTTTGPLSVSQAAGTSPYTSVITPCAFRYPLLSCCRNNGTSDILPWSNTYSHINPSDGKDYGLMSYWFKDWLDTIGLTNVYEQNIYLPRVVLKQLTFDTILTNNNIPYLLKSYTEPLPYKEFILAKLVRLSLDKTDGTVSISANIYVKLYWEDVESEADFTQAFIYTQPTYSFTAITTLPIPYLYRLRNIKQGKLIIKAYSDPLEKNLLPDLYLNILLRIAIKEPSGALLEIIQFNDFAPIADISLKPGNYNTKIYLKDGTANIALSTLYNDVDLIAWTKDMIAFKYIYNTYLPSWVAGRGIDGPYENSNIVMPFTLITPKPIRPQTSGKYMQTGTVDVPEQLCGSPITVDGYMQKEAAYTKDIAQEIELRYSPNYIIIQ